MDGALVESCDMLYPSTVRRETAFFFMNWIGGAVIP